MTTSLVLTGDRRSADRELPEAIDASSPDRTGRVTAMTSMNREHSHPSGGMQRITDIQPLVFLTTSPEQLSTAAANTPLVRYTAHPG